MVGKRTKTIVVALSLLVGFTVAPGFALAVSTDAQNTASVSNVAGQDGDGEGDGANTTLENLTVETLTLENVTVENALVEQATVNGEEQSNLTIDSVTVENATLTNVTFRNITLTDRELLDTVVGGTRATPGQNNSVESLDISDQTIDGLLINEATVQDASGVQFGKADGGMDDGETEQAGRVTADNAQVVIENVTVKSITQNGGDADDENRTDTETEVDASDESETETETESGGE